MQSCKSRTVEQDFLSTGLKGNGRTSNPGVTVRLDKKEDDRTIEKVSISSTLGGIIS